jgi:hypothetical protein
MEHVILNLGQLTYLRLGGFWMVNSIPNFFLFFMGRSKVASSIPKFGNKKRSEQSKACRMLANHESKHKCLLMMPLKKNGRKD